MGSGVGVRSAVRSGGSEGVGVGWRQNWRQIERRSWGRQRLLSSARASTLGIAAGEGVGARDSVSKGVGVGYGRGGVVMCVVGGRGGSVTCVVGDSKGVGGVWLASARASVESGLQQRWSQRQQGRWRRLVYSENGGLEAIISVRANSSNGNVSEGVGGVWGDSGDGNGRQRRQIR